MQDCVDKFVDFNIDFTGGAESLAVGAVVSKDLSFDGDVWGVSCYPCGAPGDDGAGEYLSVHLTNKSTQRSCKVLFEAVALGRATAGEGDAAAPPSLHSTFRCVVDYLRGSVTRIFRTSELAEHCVVCGYVTVVCGIAVLRDSPIPVPLSSHADDLRGLEVRNRYGEPDVSFAVDGKYVHLNRSVLAARSPFFKAALDRPTEESGMLITIDAQRELKASTLYAVLFYIYCDRLPRGNECGVPVTTELLRELLVAADRFGLPRLKLMCAKKLWENASVETVSKTLWYAHEYRCEELKKACINFITAEGNMHLVVLTEEFLWLLQKSPSIVSELKGKAVTKY